MFKDAWFIARKDVQYLLRERATLLWLFIMPVIFIYFNGTITKGFYDGGGSQKTTIAMRAPVDAGFLVEQVKLRLEDNDFRIVIPETEEEFADYSRRLEIPPGFTDSVLQGKPVKIDFRSKSSGLSQTYHEVRVKRAFYTVLADVIASVETGETPAPEVFQKLNEMPRTLTLIVRQGGKRLEIPSGFDQAIPGIMVMFTMLVLLTSGAILLFIERSKGLLRRLASTPITRGQIVLGKWGGKMILGLLQIIFAMIIGTALFKMNWGPDIPMVMLVLFAWGAFCASLGLVLANIGKTEGQVLALGVMGTMVLAALGGCWWPIEVTPNWMQSLQLFLPSGWTMDAMHKLISFGAGAGSAIPHVAALLGGTVLLGWVGARKFKFQ